MRVVVDEVASPASIQEAMAFLKRRPDALPWAGGTLLVSDDEAWPKKSSVSILDLHRIADFKQIHRSDRHLELGSMVSLASLLSLPKGSLLGPLRPAALQLGTQAVRNLATLGGNIASRWRFMSCFAALSCMDAAVELRDADGVHWKGIHELVGPDGRPDIPDAALLTRIRLPLAEWDSIATRSLGLEAFPRQGAATFCACARYAKGAIADLRIAIASTVLVRLRELETTLAGKRLPLSRKDVETFSSSLALATRELSGDDGLAETAAAMSAAYLHHDAEYLT
jgi:CO/xanthine dehydrogenase FAD-binding subunit